MFEDQKYCGKCGAKKSQSFNYCLHCGAKYDDKSVYVKNDIEEKEESKIPESVHYAVKQEVKKEVEKPAVQKYCPKCGMEIIPEDKFCIECGHRKKSVYIPRQTTNDDDDFSEEFVEVKQSVNPIWMLLFILSIINMIVVGMPAGLATLIGIFVLLFDFGSGMTIVLIAGSILALSILAIKFFSDKTSTKRG